MSYDIWLIIDTGGPEPAHVGGDWNCTSNCAPMWRAAGADLAEFNGRKAADCLPVLDAAIQKMQADPETYRAMNPPNGWGDYDSLVRALERLAQELRYHPKATVRVWR